MGTIAFGFIDPQGPLLSDARYFRSAKSVGVAVISNRWKDTFIMKTSKFYYIVPYRYLVSIFKSFRNFFSPFCKLYSSLESRNIRCVICQEMKSSGLWKRLLNYCLYTQSRSSSDSTIINYYTVPLSFLNTKRVSLIC